MPIGKFLDPRNDVAFKKIFGTEKNKDILIHFLNDMLVFKEKKPIVDVTFLQTVQEPEIAARKTSIVDILCKDECGNSYVVEMQVAKDKGFEKRAQYYAAKAYIAQMNKGDKYEALKEVIFLAIADFVMFPDKEDYKSDHVILDRKTQEHNLKDFSFTFLELGKFNNARNELRSMVEKWAYYFKHAEETPEEEVDAIFKQDMIIRKAYRELNRFAWNEDELRAYEEVIKKERDYEASMDQKYDEGFEKGIEKGKLEGNLEGRQEGKLEAAHEIALKMLKRGLTLEEVAEDTALSIEKLKQLKSQIY